MSNYRNNSLGVFIACSLVLCFLAAAVLMAANNCKDRFAAAKDEVSAMHEVEVGVVAEKFVKSGLFKNKFTLGVDINYEYEGEIKTFRRSIVVPEQIYLNVAVGDTFNIRTQEIVGEVQESQ